MGVDSLAKTLAAASVRCMLFAHFHGRVVGVDASVLLHIVLARHAIDVVTRSDYASVAAEFMMHMRELISAGASPLVVFDNPEAKFKPKSRVDAARARKRQLALEKVKAGELDETVELAAACAAAVHTTPALVDAVILELRAANVPYIVAPFEADAQLARLAAEFVVDIVWSNDTDMLVHGIPRCALKWDNRAGSATLYGLAELDACGDKAKGVAAVLQKVMARPLRTQLLRLYACLAGCDYCKLAGVAAGKASAAMLAIEAKLVAAGANMYALAEDAMLALRGDSYPGDRLASDVAAVRRGMAAFEHAPAFSPAAGRVVLLSGQPAVPPEHAVFLGFDLEALNTAPVANALRMPGAVAFPAVTRSGDAYLEHAVPAVVPGACRFGIDVSIATVEVLRTFLLRRGYVVSHSELQRDGSHANKAKDKKALVTMVRNVLERERFMLLPEPTIALAPGMLPQILLANGRPPAELRRTDPAVKPPPRPGTTAAHVVSMASATAGAASMGGSSALSQADVADAGGVLLSLPAAPAGAASVGIDTAPAGDAGVGEAPKFEWLSCDTPQHQEEVYRRSPRLPNSVLWQLFNEQGAYVLGKPWRRADESVRRMTSLSDADFAVAAPVPPPGPSEIGTFWVTMTVRASYDKMAYAVRVEVKARMPPADSPPAWGTCPLVTEVTHLGCSRECVAGGSGYCFHCRIPLLVLHYMPMPGAEPTPTSLLCKWVQPSAAQQRVRDVPIGTLVWQRVRPGAPLSTRQWHGKAETAVVGGRAAYSGMTRSHPMKPRADPARAAARTVLWNALATSFGDVSSAQLAAMTVADLEPLLQKKREARLLALMTLRDRGLGGGDGDITANSATVQSVPTSGAGSSSASAATIAGPQAALTALLPPHTATAPLISMHTPHPVAGVAATGGSAPAVAAPGQVGAAQRRATVRGSPRPYCYSHPRVRMPEHTPFPTVDKSSSLPYLCVYHGRRAKQAHFNADGTCKTPPPWLQEWLCLTRCAIPGPGRSFNDANPTRSKATTISAAASAAPQAEAGEP